MSNLKKDTDVEDALDLLAEEVREEIQRIRSEGADAMRHGDYTTATAVIAIAGKLEAFAGNVDKLVKEWNAISDQQEAEPEPVRAIVSKIFFHKARRGTITTHEEFFLPLLQALVNLGGRVQTKAAIDEVGRLMEGKLKPKDLESLKSGSDTIRWRNKVMWARNSLVNELGLMKNNSPHGVWEISEKGRQFLASHSTTRPPASTAPPRPPVAASGNRSQPAGPTNGPQSRMSVVIRWDVIGKGAPERIRETTAAATLVKVVERLGEELGRDTWEQLTTFPVSRGPLVSKNPTRDFLNPQSMEVYNHASIHGTNYHVLTHSDTDEKIETIKKLTGFLRQPAAFLEPTKHPGA